MSGVLALSRNACFPNLNVPNLLQRPETGGWFLRHARRSRQEGAAVQSFRSGCNLAEEATFIFIVEIKEHRKQAGYRSGHQTRHASAVYSPLMRLRRRSSVNTFALYLPAFGSAARHLCVRATPLRGCWEFVTGP